MWHHAGVGRYLAILSRDAGEPGKHVTVVASSLEEAREKLEAEHGKGTVYDLHEEARAAEPRL